MEVSFYRSILNVNEGEVAQLSEVLEAIKNGDLREEITELRKLEGAEYSERKRLLPIFTPSGTFAPSRSNKNIAIYNQVIILDFDHVGDAVALRNRAAAMETTYAAFVSPGGDGLKVLVKTDATPETHEQAYFLLTNYYSEQLGAAVDTSGKDISRPCFFSYDPDLYVNNESEIFNAPTSTGVVEFTEPTTTMDVDAIIERAERWVEGHGHYIEGNRNNFLFMLACELNRYGIAQFETERYLQSHYGEMAKEIPHCVSSAYHNNSHEHGQYISQIRHSDPLEVLRELEETTAPTEETAPAAKEGDLSGNPLIPDEVYDNLPEYIRECTEVFDVPRERDMFLTGMITVLSSVFNNVTCEYDSRVYWPHLFSFIIAPPASGKGVLNFARMLGEAIDHEMREKYVDSVFSKAKGTSQESLFIPADSSAAALKRILACNHEKGLIFESEADTLSSILAQDWGNFDDLIRKAYQHEPVSFARCEKEGEGYTTTLINRPRLAVCLTGTPGQVPTLLHSAENGLFSRFMFYTFRNDGVPRFKNVFARRLEGSLDEFFQERSERLRAMAQQVSEMGPVRFSMTAEQEERFLVHFNELLQRVYQKYGPDSEGITFRMALMTYRIAMVLTILRSVGEERLAETICCSDVDFQSSIMLSKIYLQHSLSVYTTLPGSKPVNRTAMTLLEYLPDEFSYLDAVEIGGEVCSISKRSVANYLSDLVKAKLLSQPREHGRYYRNRQG